MSEKKRNEKPVDPYEVYKSLIKPPRKKKPKKTEEKSE